MPSQCCLVGESTTYVLNSDLQYDSTQVDTNSKWLDGNTVLSTRKYKTMYILKAVNNWTANTAIAGKSVFSGDIEVSGNSNSNQWFGFQTDTQNSLLVELPYNVYGNANGNVNYLGVSGSFTNANFVYSNVAISNINVSEWLWYNNNLGGGNLIANSSNKFPAQLNGKLVNGNVCNGNVVLSVNGNVEWNRLTNATFDYSGIGAGNNNTGYSNFMTLVNSSCDPCGADGLAIPNYQTFGGGNVYTNETYRHQFAVRGNANAVDGVLENPTYVVRVERFGKNVTQTNVTGGNIYVDEFTSNFFANVVGWDNSIYDNGNVLQGVTFGGSYTSPQANVFNANFLASVPFLQANTDDITNNATFLNNYYVTRNLSSSILDLTANVVTNGDSNFTNGDSYCYVQANINSNVGKFLGNTSHLFFANVQNLSSGDVIVNVGGTPTPFTLVGNTTSNIASNVITSAFDALTVSLFGSNIFDSSWTLVPNANVSLVPNITGNANISTGYDNINLYYYPGNVLYGNLLSYPLFTQNNAPDFYIPTVNNFLSNVTVPDGVVFGEGTFPNVSYNGNLKGRTYGSTSTVNLDGNPFSCPYGPNMDFYFFGNLLEPARVNLPTVNVSTYVGNAYLSTNNSLTANVKYFGEPTPTGQSNLSLDSSLATSTPNYKLYFDSFLGNTLFSSGLLNSNVYYAPNVLYNGNITYYRSNVLTGNTNLNELNLDNNSNYNDLFMSNILYTKHTFASNISDTWTDIGNICGLDSTNYTYSTYLPFYGNSTSSVTTNSPFAITSDTFINSIITFTNNFDMSVAQNYVFKFLVSNTQYKSYVSSVTDYQGSVMSNDMTLNGNTVYSPPTLDPMGNVFENATYNSGMIGNLRCAPFVSYTYTNMSDMSAREQCYPFYNVNDVEGRTAGNVMYDDNYLFPGFIYKKPTPTTTEFFNYRSAVDCDFEIKANVGGVSNANTQQFRVYAIDSVNKTIKVALNNDPMTKVIPLRPIRWGKRIWDDGLGNTGSDTDWYTYITVKLTDVQGTNGKDYSVVFIRLASNPSGPQTTPPSDLENSVKLSLPLTINVKPVQDWYVNKVNFDAFLSTFNSSGGKVSDFTNESGSYWRFREIDIGNDFNNGVYSINSPPDTEGVPDNVNLSVKIFSQPLNNSYLTYQFKGSAVKRLLQYNYQSFNINNVIVTSQNNIIATYTLNATALPIPDPLLSSNYQIRAGYSRFYLDINTKAVYIDVPTNEPSMGLLGESLCVYRSLKYNLDRQVLPGSYVNVTSGLFTTNPFTGVLHDNNGFNLVFTGQLSSDLSTRFVLNTQSTSGTLKTPGLPEYVFSTNPDTLFLQAVSHDQVSNKLLYVEAQNSHNLSSKVLNLTTKFGGTLPTVNFSSIRGYPLPTTPYSSVGTFVNAVPSAPFTSASFRLRVLPDRYIMKTDTLVNNYNNVLINLDGTYAFGPDSASSLYTSTYNVTVDAGDLSLSPRATLDKNAVSNWISTSGGGSNTVNYGYYAFSGYGFVDVLVEDFGGSYTSSVLDEYNVGTTYDGLRLNLRHSVSSSTLTTQYPILVDLASPHLGKQLYIQVSQSGLTSRFYFDSPSMSWMKGNAYPFVYSGLRPLVFNRVLLNASSLSSVIVDKVAHFTSFNNVMTNTISGTPSSPIAQQSYAVVLTNNNFGNSTPSLSSNFIYYRGFKVAHNNSVSLYLGPPTLKGWFGMYVSNSNTLNSASITYNSSLGNSVINNLTITPLSVNSRGYTNDSDANIMNGRSQVYTKYQVSLNGQPLYKILIEPSVTYATNFTLEVGKAKAYLYPAYDTNEDKVIGIESDPLVYNSFAISELLYDLTDPAKFPNKTNVPTLSPLFNSPANTQSAKYKVTLNNNWFNLPNTYLDVMLNKRFSVGYALDCFFIIKSDGFGEFEVFEVQTRRKALTTDDSATELVLQKDGNLFVTAPYAWARHKYNEQNLSGLTFNLKEDANVKKDDRVQLFCSNTPTEDYFKWKVTQSGTTLERSISSYDQDQYARLLNQQLNTDQKLSPNV
jgi:hypothetical protein